MKHISSLNVLNSDPKAESVINDNSTPKVGYMALNDVYMLLKDFSITWGSYGHNKTEKDLEFIINDWFKSLQHYRKNDVFEVYKLFKYEAGQYAPNIGSFLSEMRSVVNRNATMRKQKERELLQIEMVSDIDGAKDRLSKLKTMFKDMK